MTTQKTRHLSKEQDLIRDHDGFDGMPGYVVVVFKKLGQGARFSKIINSGERFKSLPFRKSQEYFAVAVNQSILSYSFQARVTLDDDIYQFILIFNLTFRASNPRVLAELTEQDPLKCVTDMIANSISRICRSQKWETVKERFRELERIILDNERSRITQYAATLGIEVISLELDRRLPDTEIDIDAIEVSRIKNDEIKKRALRELKGDAIRKALKNVGDEIKTPEDLQEASNVVREVSPESPRSQKSSNDLTDETVTCTVFAPRQALRGSNIMVQVFAHLAKDEMLAKELASEFDEKAERLAFKRLTQEVEHHSKLVFYISMPGLQIDEPVQELVWRGHPEAVQFGVHIPKDIIDDEIIGTIHVSQDTIPFGHVKFLLRIQGVDGSVNKESQPLEMLNKWKRYEHAFISYASQDRSEVLKRVQMLSRLHIEYFQDVLTLEPGDRWKKKIYKNIDRSDVFFLFWSGAARDSKWVMKEVRYALKRKRGNKFAAPEIVPVIIEGPPPVPPPDELRDIHFNDVFIYFIN